MPCCFISLRTLSLPTRMPRPAVPCASVASRIPLDLGVDGADVSQQCLVAVAPGRPASDVLGPAQPVEVPLALTSSTRRRRSPDAALSFGESRRTSQRVLREVRRGFLRCRAPSSGAQLPLANALSPSARARPPRPCYRPSAAQRAFGCLANPIAQTGLGDPQHLWPPQQWVLTGAHPTDRLQLELLRVLRTLRTPTFRGKVSRGLPQRRCVALHHHGHTRPSGRRCRFYDRVVRNSAVLESHVGVWIKQAYWRSLLTGDIATSRANPDHWPGGRCRAQARRNSPLVQDQRWRWAPAAGAAAPCAVEVTAAAVPGLEKRRRPACAAGG